WKQLERAFRKMLHRIVGKGKTDLEFFLWHNLGIIYRDRQQNYEAAAETFRMASRVKPQDQTERQILAELFAMMPNRVEDAIAEHQYLLREDPQRVDSYRALYRLYFDSHQHDKAWCLAAALTFLNKADAEQKKFYDQYKPVGVNMTARLDNQRWVKDLFHPDESLYVGKLFEPISYGVLGAKAQNDKALHLLKKYEVDPNASTVTFALTYKFVAQVLNLQYVPRLFLRNDQPGPFLHVPGSAPPAVVCFSSFLSGFTPMQLGFVIGRHLSYYRGEHFIRTLVTSHTELKAILLAGLNVAGALPPTPETAPTAQVLQSRLTPAQLDPLRTIAKEFVKAEPNADVKRWIQAVELTACRTGFLFCNDLMIAAQMIQSLPPETPVDLPPKEKIKELVLFSVSEQYFRLREFLGLRIRI
ncbi:MAG: hypothetical protein KC417_10085, partial [Myxococcales bacterium]|nr:hypothetical protein [Myxococcales bacterium]